LVLAFAVGRAAAGAVECFLTGATTLPAPIPPTERPLTV
jgi:glutamate synthase (NADPH/NADH) small chain